MEFELVTPSGAGAAAGFVCRVDVDESLARGGRPSGKKYGTLVHLVLRDVDLTAGADADALAAMHGRLLGNTKAEVEAAAEAVRAAVQHPLVVRARAAERCHRELPVMLRLEGNRLLEGVIDLAFFDKGEWTVVDFKTDADLSARREDYERQLQWYGAALAKLTGQPVRAWILAV